MNAFRFMALFLVAACTTVAQPPADPPTPLGQRQLGIFAGFLSGTWDSIAQAKGPGVGTRLRVAPLWPERKARGEHWFYAEWVRTADEARPFRQRIYRFSEGGGRIVGDAFRVPGEATAAGEWRKERPFADRTPDGLQPFEGCRLLVTQSHLSLFAAGTEGRECRGDRPGVAYERSELYLGSSFMRNAEQGYDAAGVRLAGEEGFWEFRRMSREPR
jgi:hypothetical protein